MNTHTNNHHPLFRSFWTALTWNGIAYTINKSLLTLQTFLLYNFLNPQNFSLWANTNSTIFLLLLWLDCGLRKSIPRYAPLFGNHQLHITKQITIFQLIIQSIALPLLVWFLNTHTSLLLIILATIIYITQGVNSIMRLICHSKFYNKFFNQLETTITTIETILLCSIIPYAPSSAILIITFTTKAITSTMLAIISYLLSTTQKTETTINAHQTINKQFRYAPFIKHSLIMWATTTIKSISERNFLLLFFTHTAGIATANSFKLASDTALFFYRIIMKTIGVADTALLSHVYAQYEKSNMQNRMMILATKEVVAKIARLVLPLLGVVLILSFFRNLVYQPNVFHAFLIMVIGYLGETVLLAYERLLEVKQKYTLLLFSYIPYIIIMMALMFVMTICSTSIGLFRILLLIQGVRLVSYILIRFFVYRRYSV